MWEIFWLQPDHGSPLTTGLLPCLVPRKRAKSIACPKLRKLAFAPQSKSKEPFFPKTKRSKAYDYVPPPEQQESPKKFPRRTRSTFGATVATTSPAQSVAKKPTTSKAARAHVKANRKLRAAKYRINWEATVRKWNFDREQKIQLEIGDRALHPPAPIPKIPKKTRETKDKSKFKFTNF